MKLSWKLAIFSSFLSLIIFAFIQCFRWGEDRDFGVDLQLNLYRLDKVLC